MLEVSRQNHSLHYVEHAAALVILSGCALLSLLRCRYGVDFQDEAQYVGQSYMSLIGGSPFSTDLFMQQVVSVILTPVLWAYVKVCGSTDGMVLAFRFIWWLSATATTFILYRRLVRLFPPSAAAFTSSLVVAFIPFTIPSPSYNSMAVLFLTLGLCTTAFISRCQIVSLFVATLIYPPLAAVLALVLSYGICSREYRSRALKAACSCMCATLIIGTLLWVLLPSKTLQDVYIFSNYFRGASIPEKLALWMNSASRVLGIFRIGDCTSHHFLILALSVFGFPLVFLNRRRSLPKLYTLLSLGAGLVCASASSYGLVNFAIGAFPAFVLVTVAFQDLCQRPWIPQLSQRILTCSLPAGLLYVLYFHTSTCVYSEPHLEHLTTPVASGPYQGLYTSPTKATFLEKMQNKVRSLDDGHSSILFLYEFPAGYLLSTLRPETRMLYIHQREYGEYIRGLLLPSGDRYPDYVVYAGSWSFSGGDPVINDTYSPRSGRYEELERSADYIVYKLKVAHRGIKWVPMTADGA